MGIVKSTPTQACGKGDSSAADRSQHASPAKRTACDDWRPVLARLKQLPTRPAEGSAHSGPHLSRGRTVSDIAWTVAGIRSVVESVTDGMK
jgi:hypothetical protein